MSYLNVPTLARRPEALHLRSWSLVALVIAATAVLLAHPIVSPPYDEGNDYLRIAQGDYSNVYFYYAGRVFHPSLARAISAVLHLSLANAFRLIAIVSTPVLVLFATYPIRRFSLAVQFFVSATLFLNPITLTAIRNYYFQELLFQTLLAVFLVLFSLRPAAALPLISLLLLTRETGVIVALIAVSVAILTKRHRLALLIVVFSLPPLLFSRYMVSIAKPNKHGVGILATDLLKIPYNVAHNILGVVIWTDTNADTTRCVPRLTLDVSDLHLGSIRRIGICGWDPTLPINTGLILLTSFGMFPVLLVACRPLRYFRLASPTWIVAVVSGACMLLLAPLIGTTVSRYIIYASPVWWAMLPSFIELSTRKWLRRVDQVGLVAANLALMWFSSVLGWIDSKLLWFVLAIGVLAAVTYVGVRLWTLGREDSQMDFVDGYAEPKMPLPPQYFPVSD